MSLPAERTMPVVTAYGPAPDRSYTVCLPGNVRVIAKTRAAAEELVRRHAPGSALRWVAWGLDSPKA